MLSEHVPQFAKDPTLWLEDGSIVIIAQTTAFCVHRSILARHSEAFSSLFTLPQPVDGAETFEGYPVVRVPDSSNDFRHLLLALYDGLSFLDPTSGPTSFNVLAALVRLGHKYDLQRVLSAAVSRLELLFADFEAWKKHSWLSHRNVLLKSTSEAIEAYNLFRISGQTVMLPMALYMCCHISVPHLLQGCERADGTLEQLSPDDIGLCLLARNTLLVRKSRLVYAFCNVEPPQDCASLERCRTAVQRLRDLILQGCVPGLEAGLADFTPPGLFRMLHATTKVLEGWPEGLCASCSAFLHSRAIDLPKAMWMDLPELLGMKVDKWPPST
ncbi:hypothetical protein C8T65DRAFT_802210 [Cerioporus squamosus]|nr:hypothetical protein C8T65DRAFT_802210 [Cerioporus squamosus]